MAEEKSHLQGRAPTVEEWTDPSAHTKSHSRKKNTKRWCRGKKGVEHTPETTENRHFAAFFERCRPGETVTCYMSDSARFGAVRHCFHSTVCSTCHKVLDDPAEYCPILDGDTKK